MAEKADEKTLKVSELFIILCVSSSQAAPFT